MTEQQHSEILEYDDSNFEELGSLDSCYKCEETPAVALKQIQEWEYKEEDRENSVEMVKLFLCQEHHNLMIQKGAEMVE